MFADEPTPSNTPPSDAETNAVSTSPAIPQSAFAAIEDDLFCPKCGYNLRGLTSNRCPECGHDIQVIRQRQTQIPWVYRDKEGAFRAYWKTVWMVTNPRDKRFSLELSRPVDEGHARSFRRVTLLHSYLPVLLLTLLWSISGMTVVTPEAWIFAVVINVAIIACIVLTTAVPHYALYHRDVAPEILHRAAVLAFYTCAPLAWTFVLVLLMITGFIVGKMWRGDVDLVLYGSAMVGLVMLPFFAFGETQRVIKPMLGSDKAARRTMMKISMLGFLAFFTTLFGIPFVLGFLALVYYSLQ